MTEVWKPEKGFSYSLFAFVPHPDGGIVCSVRDNYPDEKFTRELKKLPGGGLEEDETFEEGLYREVLGETGLAIDTTTMCLTLRTHKTSYVLEEQGHRDYTYIVAPPAHIPDKLQPGEEEKDEIAWVDWMSDAEVNQTLARGGFIPNHAIAILWLRIRDEFVRERRVELLLPLARILKNSSLAFWSEDQGVLTLCYQKACEECTRVVRLPHPRKVVESADSVRRVSRPRVAHQRGERARFHEVGLETLNNFEGFVGVVILYNRPHQEPFLFLAPGVGQWEYALPECRVEHGRLMHAGGEPSPFAIKRIYQKHEQFVAVVEVPQPDLTGWWDVLERFSLSREPEFHMPLYQWEKLLEVLKEYEETLPVQKKLHINRRWHEAMREERREMRRSPINQYLEEVESGANV